MTGVTAPPLDFQILSLEKEEERENVGQRASEDSLRGGSEGGCLASEVSLEWVRESGGGSGGSEEQRKPCQLGKGVKRLLRRERKGCLRVEGRQVEDT